MNYVMYVLAWVGVVFGIAGLVIPNPMFVIASAILLFVYSIHTKENARNDKEDKRQPSA